MLLSVRGSKAVAGGAALLAVLLLASVLSSPARAALPIDDEQEFCRPHQLHDYTAPFERMPKLRQPSPTGKVGFGPESLRLWSAPALVFGGGEVGFALKLAHPNGLSLPWSGKASLVEVNGNGRPIGKPRRLAKPVGPMDPSRGDIFSFAVSEEPAFYRATIAFHGASGQKLGKFSTYYRVMHADQEARLRLNATAYRAGTSVVARVENFAAVDATYGLAFRIERLEGETWTGNFGPRGPVAAIALISQAGMSGGKCLYFGAPSSLPAGRYRMVEDVHFPPPLKLEKRTQRTLTAEFDIVP